MVKFKLTTLKLSFLKLPDSFNQIKIVHLSDLHSKYFGPAEKKVLKILNQIKPDYIFVTGDWIDIHTKNLSSIRKFWKSLAEICLTYGVLGNHEHKNKNFKISDINLALYNSGIKILNNQNQRLTKDNKSIYLIGVDDPHLGYDNLSKAYPPENGFKILLAHSPEIINKIKDKSIDLILCGHTHGGQIRIPPIPSIWIPTKISKKYDQGLFKLNHSYLYINSGIGTSLLPIRFLCPPEITVLELNSIRN